MPIPSAICAHREANSRLPISLLSNDLLTHIFSLNITTQADFAQQHCTRRVGPHLRDTYPASTYFDKARQSIRHTSQVCYHWRIVASAYSYLWSDMDLRRCSPEWADELWQRSKNTLVTIWIDSNVSEAELENKHIPRLRGLHASIFSSSAKDTWGKILAHADVISTQMETLDVRCLGGNNTVTLEIPNILNFESQQPSLTTLILRTCITDLRSPLFSNLTLLSVQKIHPSPLSVQKWLEILKAMPKLVKLDLGETIADPHTDHRPLYTDHRRMVQLGRLQSLSIWEPIYGGSAIFVHTNAPLLCSLDVSLVGSSQPYANIVVDNGVIKRYSEKFAHDISGGFSHSLKIETLPVSLHLNNQNDYDLVYGAHQRKPGFGYLHLQNLASDQPLISLLSAMDNVLPFVTTLSLGLHKVHLDIIPYLQKFTNVTTLNILPSGQLPDMVENALFPSLRVITCSWMSLTENFYKTVMCMVQWRRTHCNNFTAIECIRFLRKEKEMKAHYSFSANGTQSLNELGVHVETIYVEEPTNKI